MPDGRGLGNAPFPHEHAGGRQDGAQQGAGGKGDCGNRDEPAGNPGVKPGQPGEADIRVHKEER